MKVTGNGSATEFFSRNGGNNLLPPSTEAKTKYTSRVASLYKDEIQKRMAADAKGEPISSAVHFPGLGAAEAPAQKAGDDDFFDEWDKPAAAKSAAASTPAPPPSFGNRALSQAGSSKAASTSSDSVPTGSLVDAPSPAPAAPRTTTSSSLRASSASSGAGARRPGGGLGSSRTGSSASGGAMKLGGAKVGKLGVKKGAAPINFEEAARKAREEEERIARLGYDAQKEAEEAEAAQRAAELAVSLAASAVKAKGSAQATNVSGPVPSTAKAADKKPGAEVERLGMGFGRLGFGQVGAPGGAPKALAAKSNGASNGEDRIGVATGYMRSDGCSFFIFVGCTCQANQQKSPTMRGLNSLVRRVRFPFHLCLSMRRRLPFVCWIHSHQQRPIFRTWHVRSHSVRRGSAKAAVVPGPDVDQLERLLWTGRGRRSRRTGYGRW